MKNQETLDVINLDTPIWEEILDLSPTTTIAEASNHFAKLNTTLQNIHQWHPEGLQWRSSEPQVVVENYSLLLTVLPEIVKSYVGQLKMTTEEAKTEIARLQSIVSDVAFAKEVHENFINTLNLLFILLIIIVGFGGSTAMLTDALDPRVGIPLTSGLIGMLYVLLYAFDKFETSDITYAKNIVQAKIVSLQEKYVNPAVDQKAFDSSIHPEHLRQLLEVWNRLKIIETSADELPGNNSILVTVYREIIEQLLWLVDTKVAEVVFDPKASPHYKEIYASVRRNKSLVN